MENKDEALDAFVKQAKDRFLKKTPKSIASIWHAAAEWWAGEVMEAWHKGRMEGMERLSNKILDTNDK